MDSSLFILTSLFSCHLVRFNHNCSSCSPNYHAARNRLMVCFSGMTMSFFSEPAWEHGTCLSIPAYPKKSEQGGPGTGSIPQSIASLAVLQLLSLYPKGSKHPDQRELRKNEGITLIQYRKIAMTIVLSSFFQDNNNKRRRKKKTQNP